MDTDDLIIVCYTGGTCGDLVTAMIDDRDFSFHQAAIKHHDNRIRLKKPHLFNNNEQKDLYLKEVIDQYNSIPSHDLEYHRSRNHKFITITVNDFDTAVWASQRFKQLHRPQVWQEMTKACGANTVEDYAQILIDYSRMVGQYTDQMVNLESIQHGQGITELEKVLGVELTQSGKNVYHNWYNLQNNIV